MATWIDALSKTRRRIAGALGRLFGAHGEAGEAAVEALEATLVQADVPIGLVQDLLGGTGQARGGASLPRPEDLRRILVEALRAPEPAPPAARARPFCILTVGVNGCGKTTTCAKLAHDAIRRGHRPLLGATDTFRAAGSQQLKWWADHLRCEAVVGAAGADAAAVAFDAMDAAIARDCDVLIVDTAGRMHTRQPLMQELSKVRGALGKRQPGAPHETWIVLDATLGQNAVTQARVFHDAVPLTGAVVAKLDGSAKAGFVFAVVRDLHIPIRFAGLGEGEADLVPFDPQAFVEALLAPEAASSRTGR